MQKISLRKDLRAFAAVVTTKANCLGDFLIALQTASSNSPLLAVATVLPAGSSD